MVLRRPAALAAVLLALPAATGFDVGGVFGGVFGGSYVATSSHATDELKDTNFEAFLGEHPVTAVLFYAPWCFYSQQIMPSWDTAAQKLMLHDPPVHLAKLDAHKFSSTGEQYEVSAFPTMKLFIDGTVVEYDQDLGRSWQAIVQWVNRHIDRDHVLKSAAEADSYLNDNDLTVIGLFPDEETHPTFLKSARHFSDVMFAEARGPGIAKEVAEHLSAHASLTCETVKVGKSSTNEKDIIVLPRENMKCSNQPRNMQRPEWTDKYEASVEGKHLKVKRLDKTDGWDQNLQIKCCDDEQHVDKNKHSIPIPAVVMFMPHDERFAIYDGDLGDLHALDRWIMARRRPIVMHLSESNADKVSEVGPEHIPGIFFIRHSAQGEMEAVLQKAALSLRGRVFFCISGRESMLERRLAAMAGVEDDSPEPVMALLDMHPSAAHSTEDAQKMQQHPHHGTRKYRLDVNGLTEDRILKFVTDFEQGRVKPWLKSEPEPAAEDLVNEPVSVLVGTTYAAAAQEEAKDVFIDYYAPWCGHCRKLEPLYKALAKKLKHVKTLNIAKIDSTRNEIEDMTIQGYPTMVLWPAGNSPKTPVQYHGSRTPEDMTTWLVEHVVHKFDPNPPKVEPKKAIEDAAVGSGLLDPSEEDL